MIEQPEPVDFGIVRIGQVLELEFSNIIDPDTAAAYTDLTGVLLKFTVKKEITDDDPGEAQIIETDSEITITDGTFTAEIITTAISGSLIPGREYIFDGWLKDGIKPRPFNFSNDADAPVYVGKFATARAVTGTKP